MSRVSSLRDSWLCLEGFGTYGLPSLSRTTPGGGCVGALSSVIAFSFQQLPMDVSSS